MDLTAAFPLAVAFALDRFGAMVTCERPLIQNG